MLIVKAILFISWQVFFWLFAIQINQDNQDLQFTVPNYNILKLLSVIRIVELKCPLSFCHLHLSIKTRGGKAVKVI